MAVLLGVSYPHHGASQTRMELLAASLPVNWFVNGGGEVVDRDPNDVADFIKNGGHWVDYCAYPMYYREDGIVIKSNTWLGSNGFRRFLIQLDNSGFDHDFRSDWEDFELPRSLVVKSATIPPHIQPDYNSAHTNNIFSVFCLKHSASGGMYFYAYCEGTSGISVPKYFDFIKLKAGLNPTQFPDPPDEKSNLGLFLLLGIGGLAWLVSREGNSSANR